MAAASIAIALLGMCLLAGARAEEEKYDGFQVLRVSDRLSSNFTKILQKLDLSVWSREADKTDVMVSPEKLFRTKSVLKNAHIPFSVMIDNVQDLVSSQLPKRARALKSGEMRWDTYSTLRDIYSWLDSLQARYPGKVSVIEIGRTEENRPIKCLKVSSGRVGAKAFLIDGGVHAREWVSPASMTWIINELVVNSQSQPEPLRQLDWYIIPVLNPDGYEYTHTKDRMWRKNRSRSPSSPCVGVDVNRNYNAHWMASGSSTNPCEDSFGGYSPSTELETRAITGFARRIANLRAYATFHSYGQMILIPYCYKKNTFAKDYNELKSIAEEGLRNIRKAGGPNYRIGTVANILYPAGGSSIDYMKDLGAKFSYGVELRDDGRYGFLLPPSMIRSTATDAFQFVKTVALAAARS